VGWGHEVEWFSAGFPGAVSEEQIDGIRIIRDGRQWSVHWKAFLRYRGRLPGRFDAVIDEVNTVPFFTPLWARIPTFMMTFQLARQVWWYESFFPLSAIGWAAEPSYLRIYRSTPVFTISTSTERDLRQLGFGGDITLVPIGVEPAVGAHQAKETLATLLYVGRLSPSKRVHEIIKAFALFREETGTGQLWLVGDGADRYLNTLHHLVRQLGLSECVIFWGRLSEEDKYRRMAQAHMLVMASVREGWGLVVTEANACGTPAVVYDVNGLRDSVLHECTGLVVGTSPLELARGMIRLWRDPELYRRVAGEAEGRAQLLTFDRAACVVRDTLAASINP
jgi:glycosyltransferase involved in cell wall biosynthesis